MSTANRILKNSMWLYAKMGVSMFVSLYSTHIILNALGASDFGIFNIVGGVIAMLGFLNSAMAGATQRFMSYEEGAGNLSNKIIIFNISHVLHIVIALIVVIFLTIVGIFLFNGGLNIPSERTTAALFVYGSLIVSTFFTILAVPYDAVLNSHENMKFYAIIGVIEALLKLLVAFICAASVFDRLIVYGILMALIPIITRLVMSVYCGRKYEECIISPSKYFDKKKAKEMISFAGWNFLGSSAGLLGNYGQSLIANHFFGVIVNAAIGIVTQLQGQLMFFTNNMQKALNPVIVKNEGAGNRENSVKWALTGCRFAFILLAWIAIPICLESDYVLKIWLKDVPQWTSIFLILQLTRTLIEQGYLNLNTSITATGNIKELQIVTFVSLLLPLGITYTLLYIGFEPYWIYMTMLITTIIQMVIDIKLACRYCQLNINIYLREVVFPIIAMVISMAGFGFIPLILMDSSWYRCILVFAVTWAALLIILFTFILHQDEKQIIFSILEKAIRKIRKQKEYIREY